MGRSVQDNGVASPAHVVVVVDDLRESGVLSWLLRERGYDVSTVRPGDALVDLVRTRHADLVLLDSNGHHSIEDTLRKLRAEENGRDVPVIIAGIAHSDEATQALRSGADDWLPKPLRVAELLARVGAQLRARADVSHMRDALMRREEE